MSKILYLILFFLFIQAPLCLAAPPDDSVRGNLIFLGVTHDSSQSVWLSVTTAGSFRLEAQGQQLIDEWSEEQRGLRLSLSPIVSNGNGGTHHLINSDNDRKLDSQNQREGIVFPPFPDRPPGVPAHPIVIPPESPGVPTHPIVIPPASPGVPTHPIVIPPASPGVPTHPIVIPPGSPPQGSRPLPKPPNVTPPGSSKLANDAAYSQQAVGTVASEDFNQQAPITKARQLKEEKAWNVWSDNYYVGIRDVREDVDTKGEAANFIIGADRSIITNKLVGGFSLSSAHLDTEAFDGRLKNNVSGFKVGPYIGYRILPNLAIDGAIYYGQFRNKNKILNLTSQYVTQLVNVMLHATGLYQFGAFQLRPQPLISYTTFRNPDYDFTGMLRNIPIQISREAEHFNLGYAEFKVEGNYTKEANNGDIFQPYTEIGVDYAFVRPSNDQIYSGNLALASLPQVSGLFTLGIRAMHAKKLLVEASGSYLSVGQRGYDVWDARLLISYSFA